MAQEGNRCEKISNYIPVAILTIVTTSTALIAIDAQNKNQNVAEGIAWLFSACSFFATLLLASCTPSGKRLISFITTRLGNNPEREIKDTGYTRFQSGDIA